MPSPSLPISFPSRGRSRSPRPSPRVPSPAPDYFSPENASPNATPGQLTSPPNTSDNQPPTPSAPFLANVLSSSIAALKAPSRSERLDVNKPSARSSFDGSESEHQYVKLVEPPKSPRRSTSSPSLASDMAAQLAEDSKRSSTPINDPVTSSLGLPNPKRNSRGRIHTVSGERPSNILTSLAAPLSHTDTDPLSQRRSFEGSQLSPTRATINISAPSPTTDVTPTSVLTASSASLTLEHLNSDINNLESETNGDPLRTPVAAPEQLSSNSIQTPLLSIPSAAAKPSTSGKRRHRTSSTSTNNSSTGESYTPPVTSSIPSTSPSASVTALSKLHRTDPDSLTSSKEKPSSGASMPVKPPPLARRSARDRRRPTSDDPLDSGVGAPDVLGKDNNSIASMCGMEIANAKRNAEFHNLFRSVPEEDRLIEDYGCALQKEILVQGRLFISENHICFNANIFGWVTNLVIAFTDIVDIEKRMTAMIIPNAIQISTLHAKHFFASFLSREQAYDQLYEIWKAVRIGSLHTKGSQFASTDGMCSDEDDEVKECGDPNAEEDEEDDEDDDDDEDCSEDESSGEEGGGEEDEEKDHEELGVQEDNLDPDEKSVSVQDNQGNQQRSRTNGKKANVEVTEKLPAHHDPTLCDCLVAGIHYENVCLDAKYPGTVETIYNLLFTSNFVKKFLMDVEKAGEVEIGTWAPNDNGNMVRLSSYIKYLNNSLGPRSTKCLLREECLHKDSDRYVSHLTTTQTPDVPSGGAFTIKTRTCIMWAGPAESRVVVSFTTEWTKSSWLKAAIDKGASDGQIVYYKLLDGAIRKHIAAHLDEFTNSTKSKTAGGAERKKPKRKRERNPAGGAKKFGNATLETGASSAPFSGKDAQERAERIARRASTRSIRAAHNAAYKIVEFFFTTLSTVTSNFFARLVELLAEAQVPSITQLTFIVVVAMFAANYYIFIKLTDVAVKIEDIRATVAAGNGRVSRWGAGSGQHRTGFADKEIDDMRDLREQEEILWQWLSERAQNAPSRDAPASDVDHATPTASPPAHDDTETPDDAEKPDAAAPFQPSFDSRAPDLHNLLSKEQLDGDVHELQFQVQAAEERLRRMIGLVENSRDRIWDQTTTSAGLAGNAENDRG